ncbi:lectin-like domain-containing protein [Companilactobacillus sp. HBUAS56257]|uniref:lectin-like domain-containing protein n=1 Tax=Companilactobacillus sp. HBUAS56257 TaxID=3109360 RepID=UPI002FEEF2F3
MKKYRRYVKVLRILSIIFLLLTSMGTSQKVSAAPANSDGEIHSNAQDLNNALNTAPKGLKWSDNNFVKANFDGNSATIVSPSSKNPNSKDTSVIQMTNDHKQVGGIWSNLTSGNFFNINNDQTVSMWLYLGFYKDTDNITNIAGTRPGDGMAFVLHNDPNGVNSHSVGYDLKEKQWLPGNGETLGVWGTDWNFDETNVINIAKNAIQNSVAIEFDTYPDTSKSYGDINNEGASFDLNGVSGQHIAIGYPGNPESKYNVGLTKIPTYLRHSVEKPDGFKNDSKYKDLPTPDIKNFYSLNYLTSSSGLNLVDSKWHHLTIKWKKATKNEVLHNC